MLKPTLLTSIVLVALLGAERVRLLTVNEFEKEPDVVSSIVTVLMVSLVMRMEWALVGARPSDQLLGVCQRPLAGLVQLLVWAEAGREKMDASLKSRNPIMLRKIVFITQYPKSQA